MQSGGSRCDGASSVPITLRVRNEATRSLDLLRSIESTIENVRGIAEVLGVVEDGARQLAQSVMHAKGASEIDPEDRFVIMLEAGQDLCASLLARFHGCAASARADARLTEEDGVAEAYDRAAQAVRTVHEALGDAIFAIRQHDALASGVSGGPFESADDLIEYLRS